MKPLAMIPWFPGTNCHHEMARAFEASGARVEIVQYTKLLNHTVSLTEADLVGLAGGFSFGDHIRSGAIAACDLVWLLRDQLEALRARRIPILGVCNGFQILVEAGLLPGDGKIGDHAAVLDTNLSGRFEHWTQIPIYFRHDGCVWTNGLDGVSFTLPVAHGEGRLVPAASPDYHVVATYGSLAGDANKSPNGSPIAGICSPDGLVMGMMPHPERRIDKLRGGEQGLAIFRAGVGAVS